MSAGIEYMGASASTTMSTEIQQATINQTRMAISKSESVKMTLTCDPVTDKADKSVGMFVFSVETDDSSASVTQKLAICRYGVGKWNVPPECPFAACIDSECT